MEEREWEGNYAANVFNIVFVYQSSSLQRFFFFCVEKLYESFIFKSKEWAHLHFTQAWILLSFQDIILNLSTDYKAKGI